MLVLSACGARTALDVPSDAGFVAGPCEGEPVLLVSGVTGIDSVAPTPARTYWAQWFFGGSVHFVDASTVESQVLATEQPAVQAIAADANGAFWVTTGLSERGGTLARGIIASGVEPPRVLAGDLFQPGDLALDGESVFFLVGSNRGGLRDEGLGAVERISRDGTGRRRLAENLGMPTAIAVDGGYVYWVDSLRGIVARVPEDGGVVQELARDRVDPRALALEGGELFWIEGDELLALPVAGREEPRIVESTIAATDLAADGVHVYWTAEDGVHRARRTGGDSELVRASTRARHIALDAQRIYWTGGTDTDGYLAAMCKPDG